MVSKSFESMVAGERGRLQKKRKEVLGRRAAIDQELVAIDQEMAALDAYHAARGGKAPASKRRRSKAPRVSPAQGYR